MINTYSFNTLNKVSEQEIKDSFIDAFQDYSIHFSAGDISRMLQRRGYISELSFGAYHNEKLVSFIPNSIDGYNGVLTAYYVGKGTRKDYKGQGLTPQTFEFALPLLRKHGVKAYQLEVSQDNEAALKIYQKRNFKITRNFNCYHAETDLISQITAREISLVEIPLPVFMQEVKFKTIWDFNPSWQNSLNSIMRGSDNLVCTLAMNVNHIMGYIVYEPQSGDLVQLAIYPQYRERGVATALLKNAAQNCSSPTVKMLNIDDASESMNGFLKKHQFDLITKRYEMKRTL